MKFEEYFEEFTDNLHKRMESGYKEYGDVSFERPNIELLNEIEEELMDVVGWSLILHYKIKIIKRKITCLDPE